MWVGGGVWGLTSQGGRGAWGRRVAWGRRGAPPKWRISLSTPFPVWGGMGSLPCFLGGIWSTTVGGAGTTVVWRGFELH